MRRRQPSKTHDLRLSFHRSRVTMMCSCGFVRRYETEDAARRAFDAHRAAAERRRKERDGQAD